jgi:hypothetical protein
LALGPRTADLQAGRVDVDLASLADEGAHVALGDGLPVSPEPDLETETSRLVAAVTEHDPDIVLVYGIDAAVELAGPLEAGGRPFAVRVTESDARPELDGTFGHPLFLGLWNAPERQTPGSAARLLDELADRLQRWKLGVPED